jgi:8-oxo-dGTP pyrophosphatase MutT (NUDIX family)
MGISPYLRSLRDRVGHELVLLPAVAVLPWDADGRLLMVREAETGLWQTVGGSVEPDEAPADAALREAAEEAAITVEIERLRAVLGGPQFRLTYPNGDLVSYVSIVFDVRVVAGEPRADGEETLAVAWFAPGELRAVPVTDFTAALFDAIGLASP